MLCQLLLSPHIFFYIFIFFIFIYTVICQMGGLIASVLIIIIMCTKPNVALIIKP